MLQLHQRFIQSAKRFPKRIAVYDKATMTDYTYSKMLIASFILKEYIGKLKSRYIGILLPTGVGAMLTILGTMMKGKIPVMINYATGAIENCRYAREKCQFKTIITSRKLLEKLNVQPIDHMIFVEDILAGVSMIDKLKAAALSMLPFPVLKDMVHHGDISEISVILFTSGSEKEPKAVQLSHRNILHNVNAFPTMININENDVFASILPMFHVFGLTVDFWLPALIGASMVTYPNPLDYKTVCQYIRDYKVTFIAATPAFFYGYLQKSEPGDFASVKIAIAGADKLPDKVYEGFQKKHGITLLEGYGTTETSPVIATTYPGSHKAGSIGRPIPNTQVRILDIQTDKILGPNQEGKILVKGDLVMEGYLHDLEETSLRIRNGWYDTGDIGMMDEDGFMYHRGRLKRFVKVGGEMVSLVKVEDILSQLLPEDVICCVVDVPNPTKGADVVAAVANGDFDMHKVMKQLKKELPSIAIPKQFYVIDDIPMMASGKVNFREVEKICRDKSSKNDK
ncbi:MAG TPA: AMP-binding protein [Candidatus Cloacimonadota bacterium]|jgi:acyl-[acyl-carrier-protein]-phospholipid O-acyltransferase/long-chain-fatty-acid--[acyl-carrier-protein] ligase|nr:AMP-binding protein [Candidatus Cloacimonadota bacterium]MDD4099562.1 AMP-binding protein [Candidatus Cloacimonadota bacterium]MDD4805162.1 AMP-binding protein [Candidatus Cloacimonadota bacterium]HOA28757.1 AMP-binding protein [Candidatus Cloacimonadota bacterium]HOH59827.1 AMP-binding protein [Candidatus Cloacimonadota bacterium]